MEKNTNSVNCYKCGWCCVRSPCPLGIYLGTNANGSCEFLKKGSVGEFSCDLMNKESNSLKKNALGQILLINMGCTHKLGPHPVKLLKIALENGLKVHSEEWLRIKEESLIEMNKMKGGMSRNESIGFEGVIDEMKEFFEAQESP